MKDDDGDTDDVLPQIRMIFLVLSVIMAPFLVWSVVAGKVYGRHGYIIRGQNAADFWFVITMYGLGITACAAVAIFAKRR